VQLLDFSRLPDVSEEHPELDEEARLFAAHMKAREDALMAVFGPTDPPDTILSPDDPDLSINWPGGGIHRYAPREGRAGWHFVTHGLAQPDDPGAAPSEDEEEDERYSGFGIELVISTPEESQWPAELLLSFVRYLLFDEESRVFLPGHRIPCSALVSIAPETELTHLAGIASPDYPHEIELPAGRCTLVHLVGATTAEIEVARSEEDGTAILGRVLNELGHGTITDLTRECVTKHPDFESLWARARVQ
jgi:hypothetical protein